MNVIMILVDSLNRNALGPYGNRTVATPNLDRFARRAMVFDNHFIGSAPCMPARRELLAGRKEFLWRSWSAMEPFDRHLAGEARAAGAVSAMVTDHYHYWEQDAHGYFEPFDCIRMIRGHELDTWDTAPCTNPPPWVSAIDRWRPGWGTRYWKNVRHYRSEEDFFSSRTFTEAGHWLEDNKGQDKFLLWVESFDVHEPFHIPEPYRSMYTDDDGAGFSCWPPYQEGFHGHHKEYWQQTGRQELDWVRSQYLGKVSMMDRWLGDFLDRLDALHLWDDTVVIITSDHGHELGEKERFGKSPPHYDLNACIPLLIWHPCLAGPGRSDALTTSVDIHATILDILGGETAVSPHGRSLLPLLRGETATHREALLYGSFGSGATVTDRDYTCHCSWDPDKPLYHYSSIMLRPSPEAVAGRFIPGVDCPVWRMPRQSDTPLPDLLFDRRADPDQNRNLAGECPEGLRRMKNLLHRLMDEEGAPQEQYERLGLDM